MSSAAGSRGKTMIDDSHQFEASHPVIEPVLQATGVWKTFHAAGEPIHALRGISMEVRKAEFVAIMGASGSGKSTLLHLLAGLDNPTAGSIVVKGHELSHMVDRDRTVFRRRQLGIIFQAYNLLPTLTALENVVLPALLDGSSGKGVEEKGRRLLDRVGLGHRLSHRPQALAGGEQQRVAIARALMNDPVILLADEPTGNLDTNRSEDIWRLLGSLVHEEECTVIAVTHEPSGATFADRVLVMKDGLVVGEVRPGGEHHESLVAAGYHDMVG